MSHDESAAPPQVPIEEAIVGFCAHIGLVARSSFGEELVAAVCRKAVCAIDIQPDWDQRAVFRVPAKHDRVSGVFAVILLDDALSESLTNDFNELLLGYGGSGEGDVDHWSQTTKLTRAVRGLKSWFKDRGIRLEVGDINSFVTAWETGEVREWSFDQGRGAPVIAFVVRPYDAPRDERRNSEVCVEVHWGDRLNHELTAGLNQMIDDALGPDLHWDVRRTTDEDASTSAHFAAQEVAAIGGQQREQPRRRSAVGE